MPDQGRLKTAADCLGEARVLAAAFGLDPEPINFKMAWVAQRLQGSGGFTPVAVQCELTTVPHTEVLVNAINPKTVSSVSELSSTAPLDPADVTFVVEPGESVQITIRVIDPDPRDNVKFDAVQQVVPAIRSEARLR